MAWRRHRERSSLLDEFEIVSSTSLVMRIDADGHVMRKTTMPSGIEVISGGPYKRNGRRPVYRIKGWAPPSHGRMMEFDRYTFVGR